MPISSFTIVGTVRDSNKYLRSEVYRFHNLFSKLGPTSFFLVESDSRDGTTETLARLAKEIGSFNFVSLGDLQNLYPSRVERIAECRNRYVSEIRNSKVLSEATYTVVVDLDNKSNLLTLENVKVALNREVSWSALFANQKQKYYDIFALRHPIWCPNNIIDEIEWFERYFPNYSAKELATFRKMITIPTESDLIQVESAFGGLGIYRTTCFLNYDYAAIDSNRFLESEHVTFNRKIIKGGGNLFIDPQLLNFGWIHHSLESFLWWRKIDLIRKKIRNTLLHKSS